MARMGPMHTRTKCLVSLSLTTSKTKDTAPWVKVWTQPAPRSTPMASTTRLDTSAATHEMPHHPNADSATATVEAGQNHLLNGPRSHAHA